MWIDFGRWAERLNLELALVNRKNHPSKKRSEQKESFSLEEQKNTSPLTSNKIETKRCAILPCGLMKEDCELQSIVIDIN
jgi:hypothetical protein